MKNKGYRDPTADTAVGHVMKEIKRQGKMLKNRDCTPIRKTYRHKTLQEEFDLIDKRTKENA